MITAVDADVLLDVLVAGTAHGAESEARLATALANGGLIVCPTVAAELAARFTREVELRVFLRDTGLRIDPFGLPALHLAGQMWKARARHGDAGDRPLADYLPGAHAQLQADRLLTRNREFHRRAFPKLKLLP